MRYEEFRRIIHEDEDKKKIEEEYQRRYKTRNLFRPNAGPPDDSEVVKRALQIRAARLSQQSAPVQASVPGGDAPHSKQYSKQYMPAGHSAAETIPQHSEHLPLIKTPATLDAIVRDAAHHPHVQFPQLSQSPHLPQSPQYVKGDDIFAELLTYFKSNVIDGNAVKPVLEEDANCLLATVAASSRLSTLIEGRSRSGKSLIIDKLSELLPSVYRLHVCSNKSLFGKADEINQHDFLYISEFQSAVEGNPAVKEALKLVTEDKDATNNTSGTLQTLSGRVTVLSTGADENVRTQKRDVEVSGRFVLLSTSSDAQKTRRICDYQDGLSMGVISDVEFSGARFEKLKNHIYQVLQDSDAAFENPFARAYAACLPETQKSVYYRTLYTSLVNGFTRFNKPNRVMKSPDKVLTSIADAYLVHTLYHEVYCDALQKLTIHSFHAVERQLNDTERAEKQQECEREIALIENIRAAPVDWQRIWDAGYIHMCDNNPAHLAQWVDAQSKDGTVLVYDPIKKTDVHLCDVIVKVPNEVHNDIVA